MTISAFTPLYFLMNSIKQNAVFFCLIPLLVFPISAYAIPAITCHCFTDRTYDPARPALADSYFLATTQNSFFAVVFHTDKKTIVLKKQQGVIPHDLWIAYWVASKSGSSPDNLLRIKQNSETWKNVLATSRISAHTLGKRFSSALAANASAVILSDTVVDELFIQYRLAEEGDLTLLRKTGITNQELIIATVIAVKTGQTAGQVYQEIKTRRKTWGSLLSEANLDAKNIQQEISLILNRQMVHPG